ncbi:MAG: hypothetical protein ACOYT4_03500 [Nanoarchaeota archaeon]
MNKYFFGIVLTAFILNPKASALERKVCTKEFGACYPVRIYRPAESSSDGKIDSIYVKSVSYTKNFYETI